MPLKCNIYANYPTNLMSIHGGSMPIHMPHINSLASLMLPGVLYTDNNDAYNDVSTAQFQYLSRPSAKPAKCNEMQINFTIPFPHVNNKYSPKIQHICQMPKLVDALQYLNIYAIYELPTINHVTMTTLQKSVRMLMMPTMITMQSNCTNCIS